MLGRLSITQKLATAVVAPLVALVGLSGVGFTTFNRVKVNGPEYQKLATTADLVADVLPPPLYFIESHFIAQSLLQANAEEFPGLVKRSESLQKSFEERHAYWTEHIDVIGEPQLNDPFLNDSWKTGEEYFKVFNDQFVPSLRSAYSRGWDPDEVQVVINEPAVKAERIFDKQLDPLYRKHRAAIDKTVQIANTRRASLESDVSSTVSRRLLGLMLIAFSGAVATFLLSSFVARAIRRPIKQLTDAANRAATEDLPLMVAAAQAGEESPTVSARFVDVESNDEIAELAAAFASMQGTAVGLAREQALIRRNVGENLVNLARRNQSLLGRSLGVLTRLEQDERDQDKLQDLFKVDHLTTRMRRNAESLLVLAGAEPNRKWSAGVEMGDVVRAAVSAIEAFDRVDIIGLDDVKVRGAAVNDVAHLVAELIENATNFSPPDSRVAVVGKARPDGYLLVVTDDGLGMSEDDLATANARIAETSAFESSPTKVLGLNVVGRLAHRYGIDVSLATSSSAGIAARIQLPIVLLETSESAEVLPSAEDLDAAEVLANSSLDAAVEPAAPLSTGVANDIPEWLQNVAGVSMESDPATSSDWATATFGRISEVVESHEATPASPDFGVAAPGDGVPDNVRLLRPAPVPKPALTRRIKGAQTVEAGPVPDAAEALEVLSDPYRSLHPSEIPLPGEESLPSQDASDVEEPVFETIAETVGEPEDLVSQPETKLVKRVKGAQMVDTGPESVIRHDPETSDDPERADSVKRALTGLQRGLERGRAEEASGVFAESETEADPYPAGTDTEAIELAAAARNDAAPEVPGSLRKRVKGAQLPTVDLPAAAARIDNDPTAVRNAFGSLQRGVNSARETIAGSPAEAFPGSSVADDPSTLSASAPTH